MSFLCPATSAPSGTPLRILRVRTKRSCRAKTGTVIMSGPGGRESGPSLTSASRHTASTMGGVGRDAPARSAIACAVRGDSGMRK